MKHDTEVRTRVFVGVGANLADPEANVRRAIKSLVDDIRVIATSSLYRTAPVGRVDQPDFVNAVIEIETTLEPESCLDRLLSIEKAFGRERSERNAPRTLDLDLLLYGDLSRRSERLTLPHPRMSKRAFVLVPLVEIAADIQVGQLGTAAELLAAISKHGVERIGFV